MVTWSHTATAILLHFITYKPELSVKLVVMGLYSIFSVYRVLA